MRFGQGREGGRDTCISHTNSNSQRLEILSSIAPDYVFSGHIHVATETALPYNMGLDLRTVAIEITVPTCSYRMGVAHMGIGMIVVGE